MVQGLGNLDLAVEQADAVGGTGGFGCGLGCGGSGLAFIGGRSSSGILAFGGGSLGLRADAAGGQRKDHDQRKRKRKKLFHVSYPHFDKISVEHTHSAVVRILTLLKRKINQFCGN